MVELRRTRVRGKETYAEAKPERCFNGHTELVPTWDACPKCGVMGRQWKCRATGCAEQVLDPQHRHGPLLEQQRSDGDGQ